MRAQPLGLIRLASSFCCSSAYALGSSRADGVPAPVRGRLSYASGHNAPYCAHGRDVYRPHGHDVWLCQAEKVVRELLVQCDGWQALLLAQAVDQLHQLTKRLCGHEHRKYGHAWQQV